MVRCWRGDPSDHPAARPALLLVLVGTAVLYLWDLGASGWANSFYSAAAQAGSDSWSAMLFGASDAAGSITVDKTPLSLWMMSASVRLFGLSSWSILAPQALMGVATVALLHATVKRSTGNVWAGVAAATVLALTPVATLMFRFNNPDALLVLLLVGAVYATTRALDASSRAVRWLALGGALIGLAFLTKMLQAFLVLPALAAVYLLAASVPLARRLVQLLVACGSMIVAGGWWVAMVELWPTESRPWIGGSQNNSVLELTLGYNGLGRLNGEEVGSVGGGGGWGQAGLWRMLGSDVGGQVAWLLPAAFVLLLAALWLTRHAERTDLVRAALVVWGLWLIVTTAVFSFMAGIFHAYYTVALAPAIGALVGIGGHVLWQHRRSPVAVLTAVFTLSLTAVLAMMLLRRVDGFGTWLGPVVAGVGILAAVTLAVLRVLPSRWRRRAGLAVAVAGLVAALAGPATYSVTTAATAHTGSIPSAGPSGSGFPGGPGGMPGGQPAAQGGAGSQNPGPGQALGSQGQGAQGQRGPAPGRGDGQSRGQDGIGSLLNGSTSSAALDDLLSQDAESYTWAAAVIGSNSAAGYQLSTQEPVMAVGGFNGSDPSPTLATFQQHVDDGEIHYFISGGAGGMSPGGGTSTQIQDWVESTFTAQTVDGVTVYDLSEGIQ